MPDIEKVIKGLNYCTNTDWIDCPDCPYYYNDNCKEALNVDAITLLKELKVSYGQ